MKRTVCLIIAAAMCFALSGCAANPRCEFEAAAEDLSKAEDVYTYVYADEKGYSIDGEKLRGMIDGEWVKCSRPDNMNKVISFTVSTQYEICIFEDGHAIVYSGYAGVLESDRQYYTCRTAEDIDAICEYVRINGEEVVLDEE